MPRASWTKHWSIWWTHVYSELGLITKNADTDADVLAVLQGEHLNGVMAGLEENP